jgi:hypothetical protein
MLLWRNAADSLCRGKVSGLQKTTAEMASVDAGKVVYVPLSRKEPCECRQAGALPHLGACWAHINGTIASNGLLASLFQ